MPSKSKRETWRAIVGFPTYCISNYGAIQTRGGLGADMPMGQWKPRAAQEHKGILVISLRQNGKYHYRTIASLVLEAFHGPRPDRCVADHYPDRDQTNVRAANLRWRDRRLRDHELGRNRHSCKLNEKDVRTIFKRIAKGVPSQAIADEFGIGITTLTYIRNGETWKHVAPKARAAIAGVFARKKSKKLEESDVLKIREQVAQGKSLTDAAKEFGISLSMASLIWSGDRYPDVGGPTKYRKPLPKGTNGQNSTASHLP